MAIDLTNTSGRGPDERNSDISKSMERFEQSTNLFRSSTAAFDKIEQSLESIVNTFKSVSSTFEGFGKGITASTTTLFKVADAFNEMISSFDDVIEGNEKIVTGLDKVSTKLSEIINAKTGKDSYGFDPDFDRDFKKHFADAGKPKTVDQLAREEARNRRREAREKKFLQERRLIPPDPPKKNQKPNKKAPVKIPKAPKLPGFDLGSFLAMKITQPLQQLSNDIIDAIISPMKVAADLLGAPFRKITQVVTQGAEGIKKGFGILGEIMDSFGANIGAQTEYIIKSLFASQLFNSSLNSLTISMLGMAQQFKNASKQIDFKNFGVLRIKELQQEFYKLGDDIVNTITNALINPIKALPDIGNKVAYFVKFFDPATVALFDATLRDFYAVIGKALRPVLITVIAAMKKFGNALYGWIDKIAPRIQVVMQKFLEAFEKAIPKIIGIFDFFVNEIADLVEALLDNFNDMIGVWAGFAEFMGEIGKQIANVALFIPNAILKVADFILWGGQAVLQAFEKLIKTIPLPGAGAVADFFGGGAAGVQVGRDAIKGQQNRLAKMADAVADAFDAAVGGNFARRLQNAINGAANIQPKDMMGLAAAQNVGFRDVGEVGREAARRAFGAGGREAQIQNGIMAWINGKPIDVNDVNKKRDPFPPGGVNNFNANGEWDGPRAPGAGIGGDF